MYLSLQAQKVAQGMSSAVAEIQQDLQKERRSRGGGASDIDFDEAEVGSWCGLKIIYTPRIMLYSKYDIVEGDETCDKLFCLFIPSILNANASCLCACPLVSLLH